MDGIVVDKIDFQIDLVIRNFNFANTTICVDLRNLFGKGRSLNWVNLSNRKTLYINRNFDVIN